MVEWDGPVWNLNQLCLWSVGMNVHLFLLSLSIIIGRRIEIILSSMDIIYAAHIENINAHCSHVINPLVRKYVRSLPWQTYSRRRWFVGLFAPSATKTNTLKQLNICFCNVLRQLICAMSSCYHCFWWLAASSILKLKGARKDGLCGRLARSNTNGVIHRISASVSEFLSSLSTCFLLPRIVLFPLIGRSILLFKSWEDCSKS